MAQTHSSWRGRLSKLKSSELLRHLGHTPGEDFYSNDYLGLARDTLLSQRIRQAEEHYDGPLHGATGSRLLSGHSEVAVKTEALLTSWLHANSGLFFGSGYAANLAVLSAIPQKGDTVLFDQYAHACIKDGARLNSAKHFSFRHNDLEDLRRKAEKATGTLYIVVESVYSMDGDQAPLVELVAMAKELGAILMVDEAHSTGVYGPSGAGLCVALGLERDVPIRVHTFGKALGAHGAMVVGHSDLRDLLINTARPFIYTTAPPPQQWIAIREAVLWLKEVHTDRFEQLKLVVSTFENASQNLTDNSAQSLLVAGWHIQALLTPGNGAARQVARQLQSAGFAVRPILAPTVPVGTERVRVCLHAYNKLEKVSALVHTFADL